MRNRPDVLEYLMTLMNENTIEDDIDNSQNTPVHIAAKLGHYNCLKVNFKLNLTSCLTKRPLENTFSIYSRKLYNCNTVDLIINFNVFLHNFTLQPI